jgi:hypothetical protein
MKINNKPREVYYDIQVTNFESTGTRSQLLKFEETRHSPIIENTGDYSMSIVRFELDTYEACPTFFASIMPSPNTDINKMTEAVTIKFRDTIIKQNLEWYPYDSSATVPTSVPKIGEPVAPYYWGNSFQHYCDIINIAFIKADYNLKAVEGLSSIRPPRIFWNCKTQCAELYVHNYFYRGNNGYNATVHFNRSLYSKFSSFPTTKFDGDDTLEQIYEINLPSQRG